MNPEKKTCPGTGQRWIPGMGRSICPVCHRSAYTITGDKRLAPNTATWASRNAALRKNPNATVPEHEPSGSRGGGQPREKS